MSKEGVALQPYDTHKLIAGTCLVTVTNDKVLSLKRNSKLQLNSPQQKQAYTAREVAALGMLVCRVFGITRRSLGHPRTWNRGGLEWI